MQTDQNEATRSEFLNHLLEAGLYGVIADAPMVDASSDCFFSLQEDSDLAIIFADSITGEVELDINFDEVVDNLLMTFADEPPLTLQARLDDIALLRKLARRFESVATRLHREAKNREITFPRTINIAG